jgi:putative transposase
MSEYRRAVIHGGTYFFTVVTHQRRGSLTSPLARQSLRRAFFETRQRYPFSVEAIVLLPDHIHCIWTLPADDADYSTRWRLIKARFTRSWIALGSTGGECNSSRRAHGEQAIWQRRFWEHVVQTERELEILVCYILFNPVKHGLVTCPHLWPYSSFRRLVASGDYPFDWLCACAGDPVKPPCFESLKKYALE